MLRSVMIENWKSIGAPVEFSMVASRERKFGHRLAILRGRRDRTLPVAVIYGPNASGKSAFVQAMAYLKELIVTPRNKNEGPLPPVPNLALGAEKDTAFVVEFTASTDRGDHTYLYELRLNKHAIAVESLFLLRATVESLIFERISTQDGLIVNLHDDLEELRPLVSQVLTPGKLLLTEFGELAQEPAIISPAINWFRHTLRVLSKSSFAMGFSFRVAHDETFKRFVSGLLSEADTGIKDLVLTPLDPHTAPEMSDEDRARLEREGGFYTAMLASRDIVFATIENGQLCFSKLVAEHEEPDGRFTLDFGQESDGTHRYFDLLPAFINLTDRDDPAVYIVDELDHSLHPALTERLISSYLAECDKDSRHQLIFTTHELGLLSAGILRRDEIWRFEKVSGQTDMARFSDYSYDGARDGADLVRLYMSGRLGGIPRSY